MKNEMNVEKFELVELEERIEFFSFCSPGGGDGGGGGDDERSCDAINHECELY